MSRAKTKKDAPDTVRLEHVTSIEEQFMKTADNIEIEAQTEEIISEIRDIISGKAKKPKKKTFRDVQVEHSDKARTIQLPAGMNSDQAREWLDKYDSHMNQTVSVERVINCFPLDGAVACWIALRKIFGFVQTKSVKGAGGSQPPPMVSVTVDHLGNQVQVPVGRIEIPGVDGYIDLSLGINLTYIISGTVSLRHQRVVELIARMTEKVLEENSLYRGKAIRVDLSWMREKKVMREEHNPVFIDTTDTNPADLILSGNVQEQIDVSVFSRITRPLEMMQHGINLGATVLLAGKYGTGKTMTGRVIAHICEQKGWTFIELLDVQDIAEAVRLASMFDSHKTDGRGVVLFAEDVDQATGGERDDRLNKILNTFSGVDRGKHGIITVLTTNHHERINPAMRRAGDRVDAMIYFDHPDRDAAMRFLPVYGGDAVSPQVYEDPQDLPEYLEGNSPAFLSELVKRAKIRAILRYGADIDGKIDVDLLREAASSLTAHRVWAEGDVEEVPTNWDTLYNQQAGLIAELVQKNVEKYMGSIL